MRASLLLLVIALVTFAIQTPPSAFAQCAAAEDNPPDIVGTWEWVETAGGFSGERYTPDGVGYAIQLEFAETGILFVYQNLKLVHTAEYSLSRGATGWTVVADLGSALPHPPVEYQAEAFCVTVPRRPDGQVLQMTDACDDCYSSTYAPREPVSVSSSNWGEIKKLYRNP
jgi:hypothetical protein